jgi:hypothetical protein
MMGVVRERLVPAVACSGAADERRLGRPVSEMDSLTPSYGLASRIGGSTAGR